MFAKQKFLILLAASFLFILNAFCAELNLLTDGSFEKKSKKWKTNGKFDRKNAYKGNVCISLNARKYSCLYRQSLSVQPESYYKLSFYYRATAPLNIKSSSKACLTLHAPNNKGSKQFVSQSRYRLSQNWVKGIYYFYTKHLKEFRFGFYVDGPFANNILIDDVSIVKIDDVDTPGKNFVQNFDFEQEFAGWRFIKKWGNSNTDSLITIDSFGCIDGEKCIKLDTTGSKSVKSACAVLVSNLLPVVPGKTYTLEFWAKSGSGDKPLSFFIDSYLSPFIPPHWYKQKSVVLNNSLRKYTVDIHIPKIDKAPALVKRLVRLKIALIRCRGIIWVDNVRFTLKKNKK